MRYLSLNDVFGEMTERRRRYVQRRRAEKAVATRHRIIQATMQLHDEQGITGTSVRDIAGRAGVAASTVLHHFPVMAGLIRACGQLANELAPMPTATVMVGARSTVERVALMAEALFEWWELLGPGLDHLRIDRRRIPEVDRWFTEVEAGHASLARAALGHERGVLASLLVAISTVDAWRALRDAGMTPRQAAEHVAQVIAQPQRPREVIH